jgi:PIN domain nuclease of toxin-antitoxin system
MTRVLLDTHVFLWWQFNRLQLRASAKDAIMQATDTFVSIASAWEAAIKAGLQRLEMPESFARGIEANGFRPLPITFEHAERIATLPRHHGDPFDRMLIAQAQAENLTIVSHDRRFEAYGIPMIWT